MSSARRSLLTAAAAGGLLCALCFVPSANATTDAPAHDSRATTTSTQVTRGVQTTATTTTVSARTAAGLPAAPGPGPTRLADTGSFDSTPYVVGGAACLGLGAAFVGYSVRRERLDF